MASIKNSKISIDSRDLCKIPQNMEIESIKTNHPEVKIKSKYHSICS